MSGFMRGFDFVKIVKMGASLCEQCVTPKIRSRRLPLTKPATGCFCSAEPYHEFFSNILIPSSIKSFFSLILTDILSPHVIYFTFLCKIAQI